MALTQKQIEARAGKLTASRVSVLVGDDREAILNLWMLLIGDPSYVEENLDDNWAVQLGSFTEPFNLQWFAKKYGPISRQGEVVVHANGWAAATLDAWSHDYQCPVEVKHVGGFEKHDVVLTRYQPQMHWQMIVTGAKQCAFSAIEGAREPNVEFIKYDQAYADELWARAEQFMRCVRSLTPPVTMAPVLPPVKPTKEYNMSHSNAFASGAADWLLNKRAAKVFDDACKTIREAVPPDAVRAYGHKIQVRRDKANRLKIEEL